jgi:hypothetical protein
MLFAGVVLGISSVAIWSDGRIDEAERRSQELGNRLELVQGELEQSRADSRRLASEIDDAIDGVDRSLARIETIDELIGVIEAFLYRLASLDYREL